jgi:hypothetical protein
VKTLKFGPVICRLTYEDKHESALRLLVINGDGPSLFSREWLTKFGLNWYQLCLVRIPTTDLEGVLQSQGW